VASIKRIGDELVDEKKKAATDSIADKPVDTGEVGGRDLLSVLGRWCLTNPYRMIRTFTPLQ
jgi:hypothetical protein